MDPYPLRRWVAYAAAQVAMTLMTSCFLADGTAAQSKLHNMTLQRVSRLRSKCGLEEVTLGNVDLSHLIVGPDIMALELADVRIRNLNDLHIMSAREEETNGTSAVVRAVHDTATADRCALT